MFARKVANPPASCSSASTPPNRLLSFCCLPISPKVCLYIRTSGRLPVDPRVETACAHTPPSQSVRAVLCCVLLCCAVSGCAASCCTLSCYAGRE
eukprot:6213537-Pleurochrysis_carterae.AAC.2